MTTESRTWQPRQRLRMTLARAVQVFDLHSGECLGALVNLHEEGFMLMGSQRLQADHVYEVELRLPEVVADLEGVRLGVDCLWVREAEDSTRQWAGCQIINASTEARRGLAEVIRIWGR